MVIVEHDAPIPFNSPFTGILYPITEAPDEAFAQKMTGDGFFVYPEDNTVYAPCDSDVTFVFDTHHAMGLTASDGTEYLLHIGIDTVRLQGEGFTVFVEAGQHVQKGDRLLSFDEKLIREKATSDACICLFPELPENWEVRLCAGPHIVAGEKAVRISPPSSPAPQSHIFYAPCTGTLHPLAEAPDPFYSHKSTGDGFFIYPSEPVLYAPCDGSVFFIFEEKNALGMHTAYGLEYMLQAGIGTDTLNGEGFTFYVQDGQPVQKGDRLLSFDAAYIRAHARSDACFCIFTDLPADTEIHLKHHGFIQAGQEAVWF